MFGNDPPHQHKLTGRLWLSSLNWSFGFGNGLHLHSSLAMEKPSIWTILENCLLMDVNGESSIAMLDCYRVKRYTALTQTILLTETDAKVGSVSMRQYNSCYLTLNSQHWGKMFNSGHPSDPLGYLSLLSHMAQSFWAVHPLLGWKTALELSREFAGEGEKDGRWQHGINSWHDHRCGPCLQRTSKTTYEKHVRMLAAWKNIVKHL